MSPTEPTLLTPKEVAAIFRVDVRTVSSWARDGRLKAVQTPANHWRFRRDDVDALLQSDMREATA